MGRYIMELTFYHVLNAWFSDVHKSHDVFWQAGMSVRRFGEWSILTQLSDYENPSQNIDETCLCRAKVAKPRHPGEVRI